MFDVSKVVFEVHNDIMKDKGILDKQSDYDVEIRPRNGIDSLGIVTMILDIEEKLEIELDDYLMNIRKSKTIAELISVIQEAYDNQKD